MDNVDRNALLKEFKYLTGLLEKHETSKKEKVLVQQKCGNVLPQKSMSHPAHPPYKLVKNSTPSLTSFNKKYSFKKTNISSIPNQRIVINKGFNSKYELSKNQTSKYILSAAKGDFKVLNRNLSAPKRTVLCPENKHDKASVALASKSGKMPPHAQLIEELESLTELLKKKNSEKNHLSSASKNECNVQNKLPVLPNTNSDYNAHVKYNFQKLINSSVNPSLSNRKLSKNYYIKLNSDKSAHSNDNVSSLKHLSHNKYSYKKADLGPLNAKMTGMPLNAVGNKQTKQFKSTTLGSHTRKVTYSDPKTIQESLCIPSNPSVLMFKPKSPDKLNLTVNLSVASSTASAIMQSTPIFRVHPHHRTLCKESPIAAAVKSSSVLKSKMPSTKLCKVQKLKPAGTNYIRINKNLIAPNRSVRKTSFSTKKAKRKINTKYKVINKTVTPCSNKKASNPLSNSDSKSNSPMSVEESDSFYQKLNDSTIDKIEKNLLAISTALTSTPLSNAATVNKYKLLQNSQKKMNLTLHSKKMPLKRSKTRISKYKIVNSGTPQSFVSKKQNCAYLKTSYRNANNSKPNLINKHLQPICVLAPSKQGKSVLVKRLFKSKNTIINKNTSPINYSAKMIKSKYLTLNKRKFSSWQKQDLYAEVPPYHQKLKGYSLRAKLSSLPNRYKKTTALAYHPKGVRKFPSCSYSALSRQFSKNTSGNKRKLKSGFVYSPVVFIHGMRYSLNASGKTLKKLPAKGQTMKTHRRVIISGKALIKSPENLMKIPPTTSNVASRVLHRSINRIISASTKKSLTKVNTYCMFYNRFGRCNKGVKCTYIHDPSKIAVCTRFLRGTCKIDGCPFSHEIAPGKMALCSFFLVGACQKENCPYRHERLLPNAELCKAFVQGYCPVGKECKKAHILICPKYIQGDCDKGKSCAYPHPPKKVKKNVPKEEECEDKKPDDVLLEKVSRYFLQTEDCLLDGSKTNNATNQVVPKKRRQLEEQPSFIPLFTSPVISNSS